MSSRPGRTRRSRSVNSFSLALVQVSGYLCKVPAGPGARSPPGSAPRRDASALQSCRAGPGRSMVRSHRIRPQSATGAPRPVPRYRTSLPPLPNPRPGKSKSRLLRIASRASPIPPCPGRPAGTARAGCCARHSRTDPAAARCRTASSQNAGCAIGHRRSNGRNRRRPGRKCRLRPSSPA